MAEGLLNSVAPVDAPDDRRIYGLVIAEVITNCDQTFMGRVKVRFSWLPGYTPWARVATPMAGQNSGMFFIPQEGEEVLVAFNHGYINEPYIVGSLWNGHDKPHEKAGKDPINQRSIRTPKSHELTFDDSACTISLTNAEGATVTLTQDKIELVIGSASICLEKSGSITIKTDTTIKLKAQTIDISADTNLTLGGKQSARIDGGSYCSINATNIYIG